MSPFETFELSKIMSGMCQKRSLNVYKIFAEQARREPSFFLFNRSARKLRLATKAADKLGAYKVVLI